ncbi:MAG TPA: hypothetical protein PLI95_23475 [Polyangiaceae bacterium]|nr:hypothetical protein [Polyangiaceae bacterium]
MIIPAEPPCPLPLEPLSDDSSEPQPIATTSPAANGTAPVVTQSQVVLAMDVS